MEICRKLSILCFSTPHAARTIQSLGCLCHQDLESFLRALSATLYDQYTVNMRGSQALLLRYNAEATEADTWKIVDDHEDKSHVRNFNIGAHIFDVLNHNASAEAYIWVTPI